MSAGKGSTPRPVNPRAYAENFERIFRKKPNEIEYSNSDNPWKGKKPRRVANRHRGSDFCAEDFGAALTFDPHGVGSAHESRH